MEPKNETISKGCGGKMTFDLVCIDPGKSTGLAVFMRGTLVFSDALDYQHFPFLACVSLVAERPRLTYAHSYEGSTLVISQRLGFVLGRIQAKDTKLYYPDEWKRTIPKPKDGAPYIVAERVRAILRPTELCFFHADQFDAVDAIGLGLVHLRRALPGVV
jgi:hypothetical protein